MCPFGLLRVSRNPEQKFFIGRALGSPRKEPKPQIVWPAFPGILQHIPNGLFHRFGSGVILPGNGIVKFLPQPLIPLPGQHGDSHQQILIPLPSAAQSQPAQNFRQFSAAGGKSGLQQFRGPAGHKADLGGFDHGIGHRETFQNTPGEVAAHIGHHQHLGHPLQAFQCAQQGHTVYLGQHQFRDQHIRLPAADKLQRLLAVGAYFYPEPLCQRLLQTLPESVLRIRNQHLRQIQCHHLLLSF